MNNHSFDDLLRQKTSAHEAPVPTGTWEAIEQKKKKRRKYPVFWWITGFLLLSGSLLGLLYKTGYRHVYTVSRLPIIQVDSLVQEKQQYSSPLTAAPAKQNMTGKASPRGIMTDMLVSPANKSSKNKSSFKLQQFDETAMIDMQVTDAMLVANADILYNYQQHNRITQLKPIAQLQNAVNPPNFHKLAIPVADSILEAGEIILTAHGRKTIKKDRWMVDISAMPFLPVQQSQSPLYLTRTDISAMQKSEYKTDRVYTRLLPSVAYTIALNKKISPRLRIGAGLQYAMIKEKIDLTGKEVKIDYTVVQRLVNGSSGPQLVMDTVENTSSGTRSIDALNSYQFLSLPLSVQYKLMERGSWSLQLNGAVIINISADYHNRIQGDFLRVDNNGTHVSQQRKGAAIDLFVGLRISKAYRSFRIFAEPGFRYNFRGYDPGSMITRKFMHQAGLSVGITHALRFN